MIFVASWPSSRAPFGAIDEGDDQKADSPVIVNTMEKPKENPFYPDAKKTPLKPSD